MCSQNSAPITSQWSEVNSVNIQTVFTSFPLWWWNELSCEWSRASSPSTGPRCGRTWSDGRPPSRPCSGKTRPARGSAQNQRPWILVWLLRSPAAGGKHNALWKRAGAVCLEMNYFVFCGCSVKAQVLCWQNNEPTHSVHALQSEESWLCSFISSILQKPLQDSQSDFIYTTVFIWAV